MQNLFRLEVKIQHTFTWRSIFYAESSLCKHLTTNKIFTLRRAQNFRSKTAYKGANTVTNLIDKICNE